MIIMQAFTAVIVSYSFQIFPKIQNALLSFIINALVYAMCMYK